MGGAKHEHRTARPPRSSRYAQDDRLIGLKLRPLGTHDSMKRSVGVTTRGKCQHEKVTHAGQVQSGGEAERMGAQRGVAGSRDHVVEVRKSE
jgi:hypothetical protein